MKYLIISLLFISSYADVIITIQEKNGTIVSQKRIISKQPIIEKTKEQEQKEPPIKDQDEQSKQASEMVRNSLIQGFNQAGEFLDGLDKNKSNVPAIINKKRILNIIK